MIKQVLPQYNLEELKQQIQREKEPANIEFLEQKKKNDSSILSKARRIYRVLNPFETLSPSATKKHEKLEEMVICSDGEFLETSI